MNKNNLHVLVAGWFSFKGMGTTAGDIIARDAVCNWLKEAGISFQVAAIDAFALPGSVEWTECEASRFTDVFFICGPFGNGWPVTDFLQHFKDCRLTGINLSLLQSLEQWNPFTLLYERDSSRAANPDLTFWGPPPSVPVVGVILAHKQKEYGKRALHDLANDAIKRLLDSRELSVVYIDTALENNTGGLRTAGEIEALIAKMDLVVTTRLHGTVLAIKNGVPVIPIDPILGGAKITRQVTAIEWPVLLQAEALSDEHLREAMDFCLTDQARATAAKCATRSKAITDDIHRQLLHQLSSLSN